MINIYNAGVRTAGISAVIKKALAFFNMDERDADIDYEFIEADEMREINAEERGVDAVTDVLSFQYVDVKMPFDKDDYADDINPENGAVMLGEIFVCPGRAEEQAAEYNHSVARELAFLTVHGVLHLLGYDHDTEEKTAEMERIQNLILDSAGITRDTGEDGVFAEEKVKFGYVAVVGRPNAGKSTLVNALVGEKVSIVSWKPQTTRNNIKGIMNTDTVQAVFVDTPGIHSPQNKLGEYMMKSVKSSLADVDITMYVVDGEKGMDSGDFVNISRYTSDADRKVIVVLNKIDHITKERAGEILTEIAKIKDMKAVVPVSAMTGKNIGILKNEIEKLLDYGKREFPADIYTDSPMRFMAREIIREKALRLLDKEIPYGIAVNINKYEIRDDGLTEIDADVICQKTSHKPIILGKNGAMIKKIATYSRQDLEKTVGGKVFLTLWVRVKDEWRDDSRILTELEYN